MEYLDLYYIENDKLPGETLVRGGKVPEGSYFNVVICYMENSKGEFLIKRASIQKGHKCSSTGGHVQAGQTLKEAMVREIKEEIGIDVSEDELEFKGRWLKNNVVMCNAYYMKRDIDINECKLQEEEVESVKYMDELEIIELINQGKFLESHALLFKELMNKKTSLI